MVSRETATRVRRERIAEGVVYEAEVEVPIVGHPKPLTFVSRDGR
jgi:hypothetical protein